MRSLLLAVMVSVVCIARALAGGVAVGMARSDVEAALGKPSAALQRGDRLVLVYPNNGRVELANGRVVEMANVEVSDEVFEVPEAPSASATPSASPSPTGSDTKARAAETPPSVKAKTLAAQPAQSATPGDYESDDEDDDHAALPILALLIVGACRTLVMIVVLKLAFKWADVHADWLQMIAPAVADTVVRMAIILIAEKAFGTTDLFYLDEAIAYFALIFVLRKTTHACTLSRALTVAAAAKLTSIIVGSLIVVLVLNILG